MSIWCGGVFYVFRVVLPGWPACIQQRQLTSNEQSCVYLRILLKPWECSRPSFCTSLKTARRERRLLLLASFTSSRTKVCTMVTCLAVLRHHCLLSWCISSCGMHSKGVVTRGMFCFEAPPSPELVDRVRDLYHKRVSDVRFLIPVLNGLTKVSCSPSTDWSQWSTSGVCSIVLVHFHKLSDVVCVQKEVISALPKLIKLNPVVVKEVFNRLLGPQGEAHIWADIWALQSFEN